MRWIDRHALPQATELLDAFPVLAITGARQVGKSSLAQKLCDARGGTYVTLDEIASRSHALLDPQGFVAARKGLTVIDEVQLAPELLRAIKLEVDRNKAPGRFVITGSANLLRLRSVTETLAGRSAWLELGPLCWSELLSHPAPDTLDRAFSASGAASFVRSLGKPVRDHAALARRRAVEGSMPGTVALSAAQRQAWYKGYRQTFLERDLRQLSQIENLPEFNRLLALLSLRSAALLNKSALASDASLSHATLRRYLSLLEVAFQIRELAPFHANLAKRLVKTPKAYLRDCGMAAHLMGVQDWNGAEVPGLSGPLFETWVVSEILALDALAAQPSRTSFFRTSTGKEVDLILERGPRLVAVEIKAGATVREQDTAGIRELIEALGKKAQLGIVACLCDAPEVVSDRLCIVPVASLLGAVRVRGPDP
jgi:uncharacterized protein